MSIALYFVSAAVLLAYGSYIAGAITAVVAVLYTFCALSWRSRIPFATVMLKTIVSIVRTYPSTIFAGFCGLLLDVMFFVFWALTFAATINRYSGENDQGKQYGLSVYLLFSFYWTSEVTFSIIYDITLLKIPRSSKTLCMLQSVVSLQPTTSLLEHPPWYQAPLQQRLDVLLAKASEVSVSVVYW